MLRHLRVNDRARAMTFDEPKAEPRQGKPLQIFISVFSVSLKLNSPPAQHGSDEQQVVAAAAAAQSSFHLEEHTNAARSAVVTLLHDMNLDCVFHLADFCSVLQAVVKWVSGETSSDTHHGQNTSEHGTQDQDFTQTRVTRHTGHAYA